MKESKVIIIHHYEEEETDKTYFYFVLSFRKTILVIKETRIKILQKLLSEKEKLEICFLSNTKEIFDGINDKAYETKIKYDEITNEEYFEEEINEINYNFFRITPKNIQYNDILKIIQTSISGYLIKQSYYYSYDRIDNFNNKMNEKIKPKEIKKDEIIELRYIGTGSLFKIILCYYIEYEKLVVIKKYISPDPEIKKLLKREIENYEEINHPFIPKFYGTIKYKDLSYPIIEFINGKTLFDTDLSQFLEAEISEIILQMLLVINYLHYKHFIYRDLKPNNVIIDENKTLVLIDFDRMIKDRHTSDKYEKSAGFSSEFEAPELYLNDITNKCDIYSIGKMIEFIIEKKDSMMNNYKNAKIYQKYKECFNNKAELRPSSSELFTNFISFIMQNNIENINKFIYYLILASNKKYSRSAI